MWGLGVAGFVAADLSAGFAANEPLSTPGPPSFSGSVAYKDKGFGGIGMGAGVMADVGYSRSVGSNGHGRSSVMRL